MLKNTQPYVACQCPFKLVELIEIDAKGIGVWKSFFEKNEAVEI
jgi:hypothetical protein